MVDYKEATVLSTTDEQITLMQWLQKLTKTFGNAVITDMSLSNDGDKSLTFTFTLADGSTKTATATAITMTEDEKALIGELVKTVTASSDGVTFNKAVTIVGNVSYQGNGIHQGTESFLGETSFTKAPTCKTTATEANQLITKSYVDEANEKCYQALKTVTKDFTRTDPVYVRIGEDGEPEIHYIATSANYSYAFNNMDFGDGSFYFHNGKIVTNMSSMMRGVTAKRIIIDSTASATALTGLFRDVNGSDMSGTLIDASSATDISLICDEMIGVTKPPRFANTEKCTSASQIFGWCASLLYIPEMDLSCAKSLIYAFDGCSKVTEFHAKNMKVSFSLSSTALKHDAILEVFNNLGTVSKDDNITLTLGIEKIALMSDEELAIATEKGWYLA